MHPDNRETCRRVNQRVPVQRRMDYLCLLIANGTTLNSHLSSATTDTYRIQKFVRKHAGSVATAALVMAAIILGLVISTAMYFRSEAMRIKAEQAKEKEAIARTQAEQAENTTKEHAEKLRRTLYVNSIQLADAKYRDGNISRMRKLLAACPNDLRGWEWDRLNHIQGESIMTLHIHNNGLWIAAFSHDGRRVVATTEDDKTMKVWDTQTGAEVATLRGHEDSVFSPDGKQIVTGSDDKTIKVWDAETGAELMTLRGHGEIVNSVAFSPDGKRIVSGSEDTMIKLWDSQSGAEVKTLRGPEWIGSVAFSPDGRRIVSSAGNNTIKI